MQLFFAHFVAIFPASHYSITRVIQGAERDELLLDFFSSPLGTDFLSLVSNVTVFLSNFFLKTQVFVGTARKITVPANV